MAWDRFRTYNTFRELSIRDTRVGGLHKVFLALAAAYLVYTIFTSHSYLKTETPVVTINSWVEGVHTFEDKQRELQEGKASLPWFCNSSETDYIYNSEFKYLNNTCDLTASVGAASMEDSGATEFVTYYQDFPLDKSLGYPKVNNFIPGKLMVALTLYG